MDLRPYVAVVFFIGLACFIVAGVFLKLYDFHGTSLQKRNAFGIGFAAFLLATFCLMLEPGQIPISETLLLTGILLSLLLAASIFWTRSKLRGHEIVYKTRSIRTRRFLLMLQIALLFGVLHLTTFGTFLRQNMWIVLALGLSFFLGTIAHFFYVMKLKERVGQRILERKEV